MTDPAPSARPRTRGLLMVGGVVVAVAILVAGGYQLEQATPVDQFLFSTHLEAVAVLRRPRRKGSTSSRG